VGYAVVVSGKSWNRVSAKEATARIKINKLLEAAGWRFFPEGTLPANIPSGIQRNH
jgi:hypothetical protein